MTALEQTYQTDEAVEDEDEWVAASSYAVEGEPKTDTVTDLSDEMHEVTLADKTPGTPSRTTPQAGILGALVNEHFKAEAELRDLSSYEEDENLVEDEAALGPSVGPLTYVVAQEPDEGDDAILRTRTYDLSITYDKYYQTPRVWLFGYDERNAPLSGDAMFEDIMQDYANRTVTMEPHPHRGSLVHASIHPCQHGAVMKRIIANLKRPQHGNASEKEDDEDAVPSIRSDQYLFLFLKFIQSVVPTIDYDYTIEVNAKQ